MMAATGAMSRMKLKLSLSNSDALNCVRHTDHEKRVTIRGRGHDRLDADIATGARPILDDERLTEIYTARSHVDISRRAAETEKTAMTILQYLSATRLCSIFRPRPVL